MQTTKLLFLLLLFCSACSDKNDPPKPDIKFERTKWDIKDDGSYTYRKQMVNDLLNNYKWSGVKKDSVLKLLGEPDGVEENIFMLYNYNQKHLGFFPLSTKSLVFELAADSTVKLARTN
ncbi:MAG: hypothetical protein JWO92_2455 [Chitinophagaceae bacterium]|nr:hypothetical protein [Chitinophagaceae bacterium]